jgi:hypothetical protein
VAAVAAVAVVAVVAVVAAAAAAAAVAVAVVAVAVAVVVVVVIGELAGWRWSAGLSGRACHSPGRDLVEAQVRAAGVDRRHQGPAVASRTGQVAEGRPPRR